MSLRYTDAEQPSSLWEVVLYVDERANEAQHRALSDIFLGRLGGTPLRNFASAIGAVHAVRSAHIELDHRPGKQRIGVAGYVRVGEVRPFLSEQPVMCGIPGKDHPGTEYYTAVLQSREESPLTWELEDVCGFATDFAYANA
jgi:hypothetical protein